MHAIAVGGHRLLLQAPSKPSDREVVGMEVRVWDRGVRLTGPLACPTTIVCGPGAAAGCGRLLGAEVVIPQHATGDVDTDLAAKTQAAQRAIAEGCARVVVHVGGPDEAAHRRAQDEVVEALERIDAELLGPLRAAVAAAGGQLAVCPDHGTDPATGQHDGAPVPALRWRADAVADDSQTLSERAVAAQPLVDPSWLFDDGSAAR
jgi:2,3-bisphosphoglycerate-independent phosphoglycerate mutase